MLALGTEAPDFMLPDVVSGQTVSLASFSGKSVLLVMFICCHCPYVKHIEAELSRLGKDYQQQDVAIVAISANDAENYPADSPENLADMAKRLGLTYPILFDETQAVAHAYTASCTPDFFVFDAKRHLIYRGQLDESRPGSAIPVTGRDLRAALDAALSNQPLSTPQLPSIGCNIKWKPGNEPDYFGR
jgi:peroxiredoxin